jgi:hypothetical protein
MDNLAKDILIEKLEDLVKEMLDLENKKNITTGDMISRQSLQIEIMDLLRETFNNEWEEA